MLKRIIKPNLVKSNSALKTTLAASRFIPSVSNRFYSTEDKPKLVIPPEVLEMFKTSTKVTYEVKNDIPIISFLWRLFKIGMKIGLVFFAIVFGILFVKSLLLGAGALFALGLSLVAFMCYVFGADFVRTVEQAMVFSNGQEVEFGVVDGKIQIVSIGDKNANIDEKTNVNADEKPDQ